MDLVPLTFKLYFLSTDAIMPDTNEKATAGVDLKITAPEDASALATDANAQNDDQNTLMS